MMGYKLLIDGSVVDALTEPVYVRYDKRVGLFLRCKEENAEGFVSHDERTYWAIAGRGGFAIDGYQMVEIEEVEPEVAQLIIDAIDAGKEPPEIIRPEIPDDSTPATEEDINYVREYVISQMSEACENSILEGLDILEESGEVYHYSFSIEDQMNLLSLQSNIEKYGNRIPYHADGQSYRFYTRTEFDSIVELFNAHRLNHCIYFNRLRRYILDMSTMAELANVRYGMDIPEQYKSDGL